MEEGGGEDAAMLAGRRHAEDMELEGARRAGRGGGAVEDDVDSEDLACPISKMVMEDPVTAMDGHTYERAAIEYWLQTHNTSPMTNLQLPSKQLIPNHRVRAIIASVRDKRRRTLRPAP